MGVAVGAGGVVAVGAGVAVAVAVGAGGLVGVGVGVATGWVATSALARGSSGVGWSWEQASAREVANAMMAITARLMFRVFLALMYQ